MSGKRRLALTMFFLFTGAVTPAIADNDGNFTPRIKPTIHVTRIESEIKIDGDLSDPAWREAAVADGFCEFTPKDMTRPEVATKVLMTYDESNLYAAFICHDNPAEIRASLWERDNIFRDDYCGILLDTYGDQSWGYEIFVNPLGLQGDLRQLANGHEDMSFDIIFESAGLVTDSGYQVEMAIPFASLRFANTTEQNWRIDFWRDRQRDARYRYSWGAISRDDPCFMCQWGYVTGIENIKPSTNFEILPSIIGYQSGTRVDPDFPNSEFDNTALDAEVSIGARYGITPNSSAEIAFNPDFSQVESDAGQIDVNTTFGLQFPERRPFFQEGSDLFNTWINAVYTRTINDPDVVGKFTGQFGRYSMAYLAAYDQNTPILVPLSERSTAMQVEEAVANIFRVRRVFGDNSYLGVLATDRRRMDFAVGVFDSLGNVIDSMDVEGGSGSIYGIDGTFRFLKNYRIDFQVVGSHTEEPGAGKPDSVEVLEASGATFDRGRYTVEFDGESFNGHALIVNLSRSARLLNAQLSYMEYSPTFRTDNGNTTRNDLRNLEFWTLLDFQPNREWLISWAPFLLMGRAWDHGGAINLDPGAFVGGTRDEWIYPEVMFTFKGQTILHVGYLISRERFAGRIFPGIRRWEIDFGTRFTELFALESSCEFGSAVYRSRRAPELGDYLEFSLGAGIKPTQRLYITATFDYAKMDHRDSYFETYPDAEKELFSGYILRSRLTYQFNREWNLRLVVQYDNFDEVFNVEPLLTWQFNPFTVFYVGMNSSYQFYNIDNYDPDQRPDHFNKSEWELNTRQFFAKLQYLFRV